MLKSNVDVHKNNTAKSAIFLTIISILSLILSFVKESVLAYYYGTSTVMDAYTIATQLPVTIFAVVSVAINTIVVPNYSSELIQRGKDKADSYISNLITLFTFFSIGLVCLCMIFAEQIAQVIAPGLDEKTKILVTKIFIYTTPTIILTELIYINNGVMNVYKSFALPALTNFIFSVSYIIIVVILSSTYGIQAAVIALIVGTIIEFIYSSIIRRRYLKYRFTCNAKDAATIKSVRMAGPVIVGIGAAEINKVIDRFLASFLESGSISALNYASKLSSAVSSLMISAITTIAFPEFAEAAAKNDNEQLAKKFLASIGIYVYILFPIIVGGAFLCKTIVSIVFMRGSFTAESVEYTGPLFACYLVCLLFTSIRQAGSNYFYAQGNSKTPMKNSLIGIILNIVLNIMLSRFLGAFGLALATTISTAIICFLILFDIRKNNAYINFRLFILTGIKCLFSASIMLICLILCSRFCFKNYLGSSLLEMLLFLGMEVVIGAIVYALSTYICKTSEAHLIFHIIKRKLHQN